MVNRVRAYRKFKVEPRHNYWVWTEPASSWLKHGKTFAPNAFFYSKGLETIRKFMKVGKVDVGGASFHKKPTRPEDLDFADTLYITVKPANYKAFSKVVAMVHVDEFDEISPDRYRLWWD